MQAKLATLQGPQEGLFVRAQQAERLLKDKQAQLSAAAKQASRRRPSPAAQQAGECPRLCSPPVVGRGCHGLR